MFTNDDTNLLICLQLEICDISSLLRTCAYINGALTKHIVIEKSLRLCPRYNIAVYVRTVLGRVEKIVRTSLTAQKIQGPTTIPIALNPYHTYIVYVNDSLYTMLIISCGHNIQEDSGIEMSHADRKTNAYAIDKYIDFIDLMDIRTGLEYHHIRGKDKIGDTLCSGASWALSCYIRGIIGHEEKDYRNICANQKNNDYIQQILRDYIPPKIRREPRRVLTQLG